MRPIGCSAASLAADVYGELRSAEPELLEGLTEWDIEEEREQLSRVYALRAAPLERVQSLVRARESHFVSATCAIFKFNFIVLSSLNSVF